MFYARLFKGMEQVDYLAVPGDRSEPPLRLYRYRQVFAIPMRPNDPPEFDVMTEIYQYVAPVGDHLHYSFIG